MKFENTRGIYSIKLDNGITVMSVRDYAFMTRDTIGNVRNELKINVDDVVDFVFMNSEIDSEDEVLLGIQYHNHDNICDDWDNRYFAIVGCKEDHYCEYDEMVEYLLHQ